MTFEEQIHLIELKGLSVEDERQVYTKLVCISFENRNGDTSYIDLADKDIFKIDSDTNIDQDWNKSLNRSTVNGPYRTPNVKREKLWQLIHKNDVKITRAVSVPSFSISKHLLTAPQTQIYSSAPQVSSESDSCKDPWSESSSSHSLYDLGNAVILEDYFTPAPTKRRYSLKSYLVIFLVMITILSLTLVILCSQITLPGRGQHPSIFKPTPLTHQNVLQLTNGNLIHYVGSKFMAPATQLQISEHEQKDQV